MRVHREWTRQSQTNGEENRRSKQRISRACRCDRRTPNHPAKSQATAGPPTIPPGGKVKSVHEAKAEFKIDFEDGSTTTFYLADPGSSVAVRDKNNAVEYLG